MNRFVRRVLAILQIGGSFAGITFLVLSRPWAQESARGVWPAMVVLISLLLLGIGAGVLLAEGQRRGVMLSAIFQALQIPVITSPIVSYRLFAGVHVTAGLCGKMQLVEFGFGAVARVYLGQAVNTVSVGSNVFALVVFIYLLLHLRKTSGRAAALAEVPPGEGGVTERQEEWFCPAVDRQIASGLCWEYYYAGRGGPVEMAGELRRWIQQSGRFASLEDFHRVCETCEHRQWRSGLGNASG